MDVEKAQETITAAETLVGKLQGEFKRWSAQVNTKIFVSFHIRTLLINTISK